MNDSELLWLENTAKDMQSIVEIGVYKGRSLYTLAKSCKGKVYGIDPWLARPDREKCFYRYIDMDEVYQEAQENLAGLPNVKLIRKPSLDAVKMFDDKSIDMVFIDGDHAFESVVIDIVIWEPKTKKIICGHDYNIKNPNFAGVVNAVNKHYKGRFKIAENTRIWYVTLD